MQIAMLPFLSCVLPFVPYLQEKRMQLREVVGMIRKIKKREKKKEAICPPPEQRAGEDGEG